MLRVDTRIVLFWLAVAAVGLAPGCGRTQDVCLVEGRVTQGGRGVPGIAVMFIPVAQGAQPAARSTGITDENGRYALASDDGRAGVAAGTYRVCLIDTRALSRPAVALPAAVIKHLGPPKLDPSKTQATSSRVALAYNDPERTPIPPVEAKPGPQVFDFDVPVLPKPAPGK
ncbi:carboxypeptidase-like regulatory domain-containing protein [Gemmata sp. JC673]|uniref:Carboxypeptidase-like regulatory domain-containing protein n=1 Tax=Gemmata algarum TaxID=2975278 RepID=A0ABU5EVF3_9BACT|nr:carboxypeptidase-like regulatory domain-containing protein [Gemmata algarum]MDY3559282.1 carboxypeptidase-like regulatory domain-containing protein [Gemmata algarum]